MKNFTSMKKLSQQGFPTLLTATNSAFTPWIVKCVFVSKFELVPINFSVPPEYTLSIKRTLGWELCCSFEASYV